MRTLVTGCALIATLIAPASGAVIPRTRSNDLSVTVTYTGKGTVDASHRIWVFLFDTPDITVESEPIDVQSIEANGKATVFKGLSREVVYIATTYDHTGVYADGVPSPETAVGIYSTDGKGTAAGVKTTGAAKVSIKFDDSQKVGGAAPADEAECPETQTELAPPQRSVTAPAASGQ